MIALVRRVWVYVVVVISALRHDSTFVEVGFRGADVIGFALWVVHRSWSCSVSLCEARNGG